MRKHKYLGAALLEAITHFLQHPFVKENFVKINTKLLKIMLKLG